jgi:hypothetical protein
MAVFRCVDCGELVHGEEANITSPCIKCDHCNRAKPTEQGPAIRDHGFSFIECDENVFGFTFIDADGKVRNFAVDRRPTGEQKE